LADALEFAAGDRLNFALRLAGNRTIIQQSGASEGTGKDLSMTETVVKLRLNQQQLELMDRTIAQGVAPDRASLVRLALREYAAARKAKTSSGTPQ
jgi:hypothetical protein